MSDFPFPDKIRCHLCGANRSVIWRERYDMPEGVTGVALARCRKCGHTFVRFLGERKAAARLAERWLGIKRA